MSVESKNRRVERDGASFSRATFSFAVTPRCSVLACSFAMYCVKILLKSSSSSSSKSSIKSSSSSSMSSLTEAWAETVLGLNLCFDQRCSSVAGWKKLCSDLAFDGDSSVLEFVSFFVRFFAGDADGDFVLAAVRWVLSRV